MNNTQLSRKEKKIRIDLGNNYAEIDIGESYHFVNFRTWVTITTRDIEKIYLEIKKLGLLK
jgi:hypothetical protein